MGLSLTLRGDRDRVMIDNDGSVNDATARLIPSSNLSHSLSRQGTATATEGSTPVSSDEGEKKKEKTPKQQLQVGMGPPNGQPRMSRVFSVTRGERGAHVLAGWPSWLSSVAGEAISGWIPRRADSFEKLEKASSILSFLCLYLIPLLICILGYVTPANANC